MNRIRIESINQTVNVRSQRPEGGGLDVSTGWDGEAEPADLSTTEALTWQAGRPGGKPEEEILWMERKRT